MMVGAAVVPKFRGSAANGGYGEDKDKDLLGLQLQEERGVPLSLEEDRIPGRSQAVAPPAIQLSFPDVVPGGGRLFQVGGRPLLMVNGIRSTLLVLLKVLLLRMRNWCRIRLNPGGVSSSSKRIAAESSGLWDENEGLIPDEYCA